jgi:ribosomal protein S18 acetylase RimI-like enzyme
VTWATPQMGGEPEHEAKLYEMDAAGKLPDDFDPGDWTHAVPVVIDPEGGVALGYMGGDVGGTPSPDQMRQLRAADGSLRRPAASSPISWPDYERSPGRHKGEGPATRKGDYRPMTIEQASAEFPPLPPELAAAVDAYGVRGRYSLFGADPGNQPSARINSLLRHRVPPDAFSKLGPTTLKGDALRQAVFSMAGGERPPDWLTSYDPAEVLRGMDLATRGQGAPRDLVTWRGVDDATYRRLRGLRPGDAGVVDLGFQSTSLVREDAEGEYAVNGGLLEIRVPEGTPAVWKGEPDSLDEAELVLGRGLRMRVVSHEPDRTVLEVVPDREASPGRIDLRDWTPGGWGKGFVVDGELRTWAVDRPGLGPQHDQAAEAMGVEDFGPQITITPDGFATETGGYLNAGILQEWFPGTAGATFGTDRPGDYYDPDALDASVPGAPVDEADGMRPAWEVELERRREAMSSLVRGHGLKWEPDYERWWSRRAAPALDERSPGRASEVNWFPGDFGKGWVYPDGRVVVWRTDAYGDPEHGSVDDAGTPVTGSDWGSQTERVAELASQGARAVTIDPDGQVHDAYAQDARDAPEPDVMRALRAVLGSEVHARGGRERSPGRAGPPGLPDEAAAAAFDEGLYDAAGPESEDVLGAYNSDSTWLNHGIVAGNADALRDAAVMDRIFEAAPRTTAPVTLWRGYSRRDLPGPKEGETLDVPVFMSTADDVGGAILFGDRLMEVRVPAGTPVVPTGAMLRARAAAGEDNGDWGDLEREVLLPRGLKLRLVSVGKGSEGQDVVAEVVSEGSREASPGRVPLAFAPATHAGASPGRALMDAERARLRARPESAEDRLFVRNNAEALPDDQRAALTAYTSDGGNQALDGAGRASLDALVRSHPLPEPVTVSRRIRAGELDGLAPGDVLGEDRFASTTIGTAWTIGAADDNGGLQVELPAGTPAYYVPESFGVESEVILPPNLPLRVAEVGTRRGLPWARAEADPSATPNRELSPQYVAREREQRRQHMARRAASPGRAGADHRWWTPGKHGRGVTLRDGRVWTWNEGEGNHSEVIHANGLTFRDTTAEFYIRPDGGVTAIDKEPARETVRREAPELYLLDDRYRSPGRADPLDGWTDPGTGATLSRRQTSPWLRNYDVALGGERVGQVRFVTRPPRGRRRDGIADDEVSLAWIKLDGPARGKGLSDRIIGRAAKGFAAEGYRRLTATPTNPHAVAMNERLGFRGEGEWQRWTLDLNPPERSPGRALERAERDLWRARHGRGDPAEAQAAVDAARARTPEMSPGRAAGVPEQVDRAFLASVEGEHRLRDGRVLRTRIEEDGVYRDNGRLTVEGYIEDPSVSPELAGPHAMPGGVGVFRRSLRPDPRFGYVVSKEMLWLDPAYRRQGFAADLDRTSEEAWGRIGVRRIELTTDDDGGYVWARLGYRLDPERYMAEGGESADLLLYNTPGFEDLAPTHANIARAYLYQVLDNAVHDTERDAEQEGEREQRPSPAPERLAEVLAMVQRGELRDVGDVAALPDGRALLSDAIWEGYKDIAPDVEASPGRATRARAWVEHGHTLAELRDPETPAENWLGEGQRMSGVRRRGFERTPLGLLVSTGQPDMERYASPALGRLLVPGSYGQSAEDAAEGVPFAADNGGFWGVPEADYKRMAEELSGGRKKPLWVTVPDVFLHPFLTHSGRRIWAPNRKDAEREAGGRVKEDKKTPPHGDADATIARFEQWSQYLRHEGLPAAFVAQDGMDSPERLAWLDKHWDDISAVFIGGSDDFKLGPGAARVAELAREHGKLVHVGRVNTHMRIAYARDVLHADSIDGGTFSKFKDTYLPSGLAYIPTGGPPPTKIGQEWVRSAAEAARGEHAWPRPPGRDKPQWPRGYFPLAEAARAGAVSYQDLADALYAAGLSDYLHLDFEPGTPGFTVRGTPEQQGWVAAYLGTDAPSGESWPQLVLPGGDGEGELAEAAYDRLKHPKDRIGRWVDAPGTRPWQLNGPWRGAPAAPSTFASDRMARSAFRADRPSPEQRAALERYRGDEYQAINDPLRGGREASPGRVRDDVALLDLAVNGSVAAEPVTLYRGLTHSSAIPQSGEFVDRGFVSASLSENTATYFSGASHGDEPAPDQTVAEIRLPAGARALPLSAAVGSAEGEVLLGRGSTFRVVGRRTERWTTRSGSPASVTHVALEYVGTGGSRALSEARRAPQGASLRFFWAPGDVEAGKLEEGRYDEHLHPRDRRGRWAPGRPGKGYLMPDGSIDLWNTDVLGGSPHHMERHPELDENPDAVPLTIDPEGGVMRGDGTHVEPELMRQLRARERSLHAPLRGSPLRFELSPGRATPGRAPDVPGRVVDAARRGGATVHPKTANEPTEGFAVALQGHSSITPADEFFSGPKGAERGRKVLREWLRRERAAFGADTHVGVWLDRKHGEVVLDPVDVFPPDQRDEAIAAGRGRDQQAIYDLGAGAEIPTGGTGGREASGRASRKREQAEAAAEWARLRPGDRFEVKSDGSSGPVSLTGYEVVGNESDQYGPSLRVRDESGQETVFTPDVGSRPRKAGPPDGRPFAEGEVVVRPNGRRASVLSVDGDRVTVLYRSGRSSRQQTFRASQLERAEPRGT